MKNSIKSIMKAGTLLLIILVLTSSIFLVFNKDKTSYALTENVSGTYDGVDWSLTTDGTLTIGKAGQTQTFTNRSSRYYSSYPWRVYNSEIKSVKFVGTVKGQGSMAYMFYYCSSLTSIDLSNFNTSGVTDMSHMFDNCSSLTSLNLSSFNTSNVTDMSYMFYDCSSLTSIDLSNFNTNNVTNMSGMFSNCSSLTSLNLSSFNTSNVTNMSSMFYDCHSLTSLNLSSFNTSNVTDMSYMFSGCRSLTSLNVSNFNTSNVTSMGRMFLGCRSLTSLNLSSFNTSNVTDMSYMFSACSSLTSLDLSSFNTSNVTDMRYMFNSCSSLTSLNLSSFDTRSVTDMGSMFISTSKLEEITVGTKTDLSKLDNDIRRWSRIKSIIDQVKLNEIKSPGTYYLTEIPCDNGSLPYEASGLGNNNIWELNYPDKKFKGYCINLNRKSPKGYYCKREATNASLVNGELLSSTNFGYAPIGSNMKEALITLIYHNVSNSMIWDYTNRYNNQSDATKTWAQTHRFSDIPNGNKYKLYIYESVDGTHQNLLSIEGALEDPKGGVVVSKQDANGLLLDGAEFTIYNSSNRPVYTIESKNGYAGIYRMDNTYGLDLGTYTIRETKAPAGHTIGSEYFTFTVSSDQELVRVGKKNGTGSNVTMTFTDDQITGYKGGGIEVRKKGLNGQDLAGAEFTIYKNGTVVKKITSLATGVASTGPKDLEFGTYTVKETKAPAGYKLSTETKTFVINKDGEYVSGDFTFTDTTKTGSIQLKATKKMNFGSGTFQFQLLDDKNNVLQTKSGGVGTITFDAINYNADDLGFKTYKIKEVRGTASNITYDTHTEEVVVFIEDDGGANLKVYAEYDDDGAVFNNTNNQNVKGSIVLKANKSLTGRTLAANQFEFELKKDGAVLQTKKNAADGSITFDAINYTQVDIGKTYTYTINEKAGSMAGYTKDTHTETITVKVEYNGTETLKVTPTYDSDGAKFTNAYKATGSVQLSATKALTGRTLAANQFEFELKKDGAVLQTKKNAADGSITFDKINYTQADIGKTYTYTVNEKAVNAAGYTGDTHVETITVKVEDNGNGTLKTTPTYDSDGVKFTNAYKATGSVQLSGTKALTGRTLAANQFEFELKKDGVVLQTKKNAANGSITFDKINYTQADIGKTYTYTVNEKAGSMAGYTKDTHTETITVKVEDNGNGTLKTTPTYDSDGVKFTNAYKATGSVQLSGTKALTGRTLAANQFEFELKKDGVVLQTKKNAANGSITFDAINYTQVDIGKTYTYTVNEKAVNAAGYTGDTHVETITVKVEDNGNGTLKTTPIYDSDGAKFTNAYKATGSTSFSVDKTLVGRKLANEQFTFELKDSSDNVLQSKKNNEDGKVIFDKINYTEKDIGKTYTYTISEVNDEKPGYTYDDHVETISVKINDNGDGTLDIEVTGKHEISFNNLYKASGDIVLDLDKIYTNGTIKGGEFAFSLLDEEGEVIQTTSNNEEGKIVFSPIGYTEKDAGKTYKYSVKEEKEETELIDYDGSVKEGTVEITDNGDGTLITKVTWKDESSSFENVRKGKVSISKTDIGGKEVPGAKITITDEEGKTVEEWTSTKKPHTFFLYAGKYTLTETLSPIGYDKAESISFEVGIDGKIISDSLVEESEDDSVIRMIDNYTLYEVKVIKQDNKGYSLNGASMKILDQDKKELYSWATDSNPYLVNIPFGEYTLHEEEAPTGYKKVKDIKLVIEKDGKVSSKDKQIKIRGNKVYVIDEAIESSPQTGIFNNITYYFIFIGLSSIVFIVSAFVYYKKKKLSI